MILRTRGAGVSRENGWFVLQSTLFDTVSRVNQVSQITITVALFAFIPPLSSSIIAPALPAVGRDLHIASEGEVNLVLSVYLLPLAFAPLVFAPCSEMWGRKRILQFGNMFFLLLNLSCGFVQNKAAMISLRLLTGVAGAATSGVSHSLLIPNILKD
jgi:MFS family permease